MLNFLLCDLVKSGSTVFSKVPIRGVMLACHGDVKILRGGSEEGIVDD